MTIITHAYSEDDDTLRESDRDASENTNTQSYTVSIPNSQPECDAEVANSLPLESSKAAFLCYATADFQPPSWACEPLDSNTHARLEAYRDSRHCATYMVATKRVCTFGRDQQHCDHVLGNPSISRKHAAFVHDDAGGVYIADLMSRHGTFLNRKRIPPYDPLLLHDGDIIKFGQSIRTYVLRGVSAEGNSAPVKKTWPRVKLKAPKVGCMLPKMSSRPRYSANVTKFINSNCYGVISDQKVEDACIAVLEFTDTEKREVADYLVDKIEAKYELHAAQVHRNAFMITMALLNRNTCVEEFESNLHKITLLSQQKHDSIYRADARKLLQAMAAVRLCPGSAVSPDVSSYAASRPASENEEYTTPSRTDSDESRQMFALDPKQRYTQQPPVDEDNEAARESMKEVSGFSFIAQATNTEHIERSGEETRNCHSTAFNFMENGKHCGSQGSTAASETNEGGEISSGADEIETSGLEPHSAQLSPQALLLSTPYLGDQTFDDLWQATTESEEWTFDSLCGLNTQMLESALSDSYIYIYSKRQVAGQEQWLLYSEQRTKGTIFLVELTLMPNLEEISVTFKWIVNSLLYDNGHELFIQIIKQCMQDVVSNKPGHFIGNITNLHRTDLRMSPSFQNINASAITNIETDGETNDKKDQTHGEVELFEIREYLVSAPVIDPAQFEHIWINGSIIGTISYSLECIPESELVIDIMKQNALACLASGCMDNVMKFFFFSESLELSCVFCVEICINTETARLSGTVKRFGLQTRLEKYDLTVEEIDASFVCFLEEILEQYM